MIKILIVLILAGCSQKINKPQSNFYNAEQLPVINQLTTEKENYALYIEKSNMEKAKHEPDDGLYLGFYMDQMDENLSIERFESLVSKKHAFYVHNYTLGTAFPESFILNCISKLKTPNIIINPPNEYDPFNKTLLIKTAKEFGKYKTPMFIHFYPNPTNYNSDEYVSYFKLAYEVFNQYLNDVTFVFSIKTNELLDYRVFYPGDQYVDWIGLNYYEMLNNENKFDNSNFSSLEYFYYIFQNKKPIFISQYAVSNYSDINNTYYTAEASKKITDFYNTVANYYPRIKAINYINTTKEDLNQKNKTNNFLVTENKTILNNYKQAIKDDYFLSSIKTGKIDSFINAKSPFDVYKIDRTYYISEKSISFDMNILEVIAPERKVKYIDGEKYFDINILTEKKYRTLEIDETQKKIIVLLN